MMRGIARACSRLAAVLALGLAALQAPAQVVISQVYGGGGNGGAPYLNDYVELYNRGSTPQALAGWSLQYTSASGTSWGSQKVLLSGTLAPGGYLLVQLGSGGSSGVTLPTPDLVPPVPFNMSATAGKLALLSSTASLPAQVCPSDPAIVDRVGYGASANCAETAPAPAPSATTALVRAASGCTDTQNNAADFTAGLPTPRNGASPAGTCGAVNEPIVAQCSASLSVASGAVLPLQLSASDSDSIVNAAVLTAAPAGVSLAGVSPAAADGGRAVAMLAFDGSTPAGSHTLGLRFDNNEGQQASCSVALTVLTPTGALTPVFTIQGSGGTSPLAGSSVTTRGTVTRVNNNGYYLQDEAGDGNPETSDAIFVFTGSAPAVAAGLRVQVSGPVVEFNTGAATNGQTLANPVTQIALPTATVLLGTGSVTPTPVTLPLPSETHFERYEGMLLQLDTPLVAGQNFFLGRYGQVTLSGNARSRKPTDRHRPGTAEAQALQSLNARNTLILDDGTSQQNPDPTPYLGADNTLRAGDVLPAGLVGVLDYGLATNSNTGPAAWRVHPVGTPLFARSNPRTASPRTLAGNLRVASFNVLNYFTTFGDGNTAFGQTGQVCTQGSDPPSAALCRGADSAAEFLRQRDKIVSAMVTIGADLFGLMELQNNGNTAVQHLVDALNAQLGAGTYASVALPAQTGSDAIRVAMIYKPGSLAAVGAPLVDTSPVHNRPPLAQTFALGNGQLFSVIVNHFKSKGCDGAVGADLDAGDGQGCFNDRRLQQAGALLAFAQSVQQASGDADVLLVGDLNAYSQEDPVHLLLQAGYVNLAERHEPGGYSYVFDGEAGSLDHALASSSLAAQAVDATHWHINADEPSIIDYNLEFKKPACPSCGPDYYTATPWRSSDHDPVVVGLALLPPAAPQTISFTLPSPLAAGGATALQASASSGLAVVFSSLTPAVCSVAGNQLNLLLPGTCTVAADQPGNAQFQAAPAVQRTAQVVQGAQVVLLADPGPQVPGLGPVVLSPVASSGLPVTLTVLTPTVCSVDGSTVLPLQPGTCTVRADQAGNAVYAPAPSVSVSFAVTAEPLPPEGDVPLPPWALGLLAGGIALALRRRGVHGSG